MQTQHIGFVFGGNSPEREVSILTMLQVKRLVGCSSWAVPHYFFLDKTGHGFWHIPSDKLCADLFKCGKLEKVATKVEFVSGGDVFFRGKVIQRKVCHVDAIVNCCHGGFGECGELAGFFKVLGIGFSTSNHVALGLSMDKHLFKCVMKSMGIKTPAWICAKKSDFESDEKAQEMLERMIKKLGEKVIVKPNNSGSSLGVTVPKSKEELLPAIKLAFEFSESVIVEKLVENKIEFNCAVVGGKSGCVASEVDQVITESEMFSFEEKYIGGEIKPNSKSCASKKGAGMDNAKRLLPAPISDSLKEKIQQTAKKAFEVLGLGGVARVDFLYDQKSKQLFVGEINAVPGSMALYFFKKSKFDGLSLVRELAQIAIQESNSEKLVSDDFVPKIFTK